MLNKIDIPIFRLLTLSIFFILTSCKQNINLDNDYKAQKTLERELNFKNTDGILGIAIDFSSDKIDWDYIVVIEPYSIKADIENKLNLDLENIQESLIWTDDSINLLVFIKDKKPIKIIELSRGVGDFKTYSQMIQKNDAILRKSENGILLFKR